MSLKSELEAVWAAYIKAYRTGDAQGCAAVFSQNARVVSPFGPEAVGQTAIADQHAEWVAEGAEDKEITIIDCGGSGDIAWCFARFSEGSDDCDGVSLNVFERNSEIGAWRIKYCSLNEAFQP